MMEIEHLFESLGPPILKLLQVVPGVAMWAQITPFSCVTRVDQVEPTYTTPNKFTKAETKHIAQQQSNVLELV